jgi:hypothetical protein
MTQKDVESMLLKIRTTCVDVLAHDELDWEYTTALGNGINAFEAGALAMAILVNILELPEDEIWKLVSLRVELLESEE